MKAGSTENSSRDGSSPPHDHLRTPYAPLGSAIYITTAHLSSLEAVECISSRSKAVYTFREGNSCACWFLRELAVESRDTSDPKALNKATERLFLLLTRTSE